MAIQPTNTTRSTDKMIESITIQINTTNQAFADNPNELAMILAKLADKLAANRIDEQEAIQGVALRDSNGNNVGTFVAEYNGENEAE